jgi:hypothetical protein
MLVHVVPVLVMQVSIMEVVFMFLVLNRCVPAPRSVLVVVLSMLFAIVHPLLLGPTAL